MPDLTSTENNPPGGEPEPDWIWVRWTPVIVELSPPERKP
jgi:hypothetical protein